MRYPAKRMSARGRHSLTGAPAGEVRLCTRRTVVAASCHVLRVSPIVRRDMSRMEGGMVRSHSSCNASSIHRCMICDHSRCHVCRSKSDRCRSRAASEIRPPVAETALNSICNELSAGAAVQ